MSHREIRRQKLIVYLKDDKTEAAYATAYTGEEAWNAYLDCYKRHGANSATRVIDAPEPKKKDK